MRVGVTTIGASRTLSSCAAHTPELNIKTAMQAGFIASSNVMELRRILAASPENYSVLLILVRFYRLLREVR
jgi:hypothetical protein